MGRYYWIKRDTVEGSQNFTIGFLKKHKYLDRGNKFGNINWSINGSPTGSISIITYMDEISRVNLDYTITNNSTGKKRFANYDVRLVSTACNFGGKRWWFLCWNCTSKTTTIYRSDHDKFLCRKCANLAYESQNKNRRSLWHQVGKVLDSDKQEKLPQYYGKYRFYRGKPTKGYKKLEHSRDEFSRSFQFLKKVGWIKNKEY